MPQDQFGTLTLKKTKQTAGEIPNKPEAKAKIVGTESQLRYLRWALTNKERIQNERARFDPMDPNGLARDRQIEDWQARIDASKTIFEAYAQLEQAYNFTARNSNPDIRIELGKLMTRLDEIFAKCQ